MYAAKAPSPVDARDGHFRRFHIREVSSTTGGLEAGASPKRRAAFLFLTVPASGLLFFGPLVPLLLTGVGLKNCGLLSRAERALPEQCRRYTQQISSGVGRNFQGF